MYNIVFEILVKKAPSVSSNDLVKISRIICHEISIIFSTHLRNKSSVSSGKGETKLHQEKAIIHCKSNEQP